ncbi:MAG: hypothetical protein QNJ98_01865 [Planctomycetota bacterium]|nr:hypothetical protein [Planctomycetota bacterium]
MKRLATYVAAALLAYPMGSAGADELPEPAVRAVSGTRAPATRPAPRLPDAPRIADNTIPVAPSPTPRLDNGLPRPEIVNTKSDYLRRLRLKSPAPAATRSTDVSAPTRSAFPRTHARRNLTIPAAPSTTRRPTTSVYTRTRIAPPRPPAPRTRARAVPPPVVPRAATQPVDPSLTRLPAPRMRRATTPAPTTRRNTTYVASRRRAPVRAATPARRPATTRARAVPPPPPPPAVPMPTARKPLTVPPAPCTQPEPTPTVRSLLQPVPGCEDG